MNPLARSISRRTEVDPSRQPSLIAQLSMPRLIGCEASSFAHDHWPLSDERFEPLHGAS